MERNVYLEGELGEKFGAHCFVEAPTVSDALKLLDVNNSDFRKYLFECHEKGIGFAIDVAQNDIEYAEELLLPLHPGDITITPVPEGGGGGFKKILMAALIVAAIYISGGMALQAAQASSVMGGTVGWGSISFGAAFAATGTAGLVAAGLAVSLAMTGLTEMMAPDPSVDAGQEQSYLFNGMEQNVIAGDPVPVLYGKLRVPGQPINFEVKNSVGSNTYTPKDYSEYGIQPAYIGFGYSPI